MIKAIYFDYHGVLDKRSIRLVYQILAATETAKLKQLNDPLSLRKHYFPLEIEYLAGDITPAEFWGQFIADRFDPTDVALAKQSLLTIDLNQGLWQIIPELKKRYFLGIISDSGIDKTQLIEESLDLKAYFDGLYFSSDRNLVKEAGLGFYYLPLQENNFQPADCLLVDDSPNNISQAKTVGYNTHLYRGNNQFLLQLI
ncbi:HAD family hydrolase [Floridanema aerugineum]|uniref:HAD family hydrolase n=1 Tax=Floridaenema aerugineum BLCC-F46 TaxID=3153654 RepID=A0ABV4X0X3_9CYAN